MKKWLKILLSLNSLRKSLGSSVFLAATKYNYHIEIVDEITAKKVLVLAPHPDDDCFGVGGTIKKMTNSGANVTVAYFCDGSGGVKEDRIKNYELRIKNSDVRNKGLISIRKEEARETKEILGVAEQVFLGYPDGHLASGTAANKVLRDLIKRLEPDIIFVPSFIDNHPDHRAVNDILISVLTKYIEPTVQTKKGYKFPFEIWAYEVWSPIFANRVVMINDEIDDKILSMRAHKSQLEARGYEKAILGLNQYRAQINNQDGFAEAFFAATPEIYKIIYEKTKK